MGRVVRVLPGDDRRHDCGAAGGEGQVFEYNPFAETIKLIYNSPSALDCENPDNLVGHAARRPAAVRRQLRCDDQRRGAADRPDARPATSFTFAKNNIVLGSAYNAVVGAGDYRQNEWAGACYSPDGKWLFVNIQTPGVTFAITGPWAGGPL